MMAGEQLIFPGALFATFEDLKSAVFDWGERHETLFVMGDAKKSKSDSNVFYDYAYVTFVCKQGGKIRPSRSKGIRPRNQSSVKCGCPVKVRATASRTDGRLAYKVTKLCLEHNHSTSDLDIFFKLPRQRRMDTKEKAWVHNLLQSGEDKKAVQERIRTETGKQVTMKDLHNMVSKRSDVTDDNSDMSVVKKQKKTKVLKSGPLAGRVAVVTGASSGIGKAVGLALAFNGVKVGLAARRVDLLESIAQEIVNEGGMAVPIKTDVTDRAQVKNLISQTEAAFGPVDILVNCAGLMYYTMMKNLHEDEWERQVDVNCKGVLNGVGAVLDKMIERHTGHIVNISSDAGRKAFPGLAVYSGTKFFVEGMSQALRQEVAGTGVRVTCIQPGDVRTPLVSISTDKEAVEKYDGSQSVKILEPEDIGKAVVYALSQPRHVAVNEILVEPREAPA